MIVNKKGQHIYALPRPAATDSGSTVIPIATSIKQFIKTGKMDTSDPGPQPTGPVLERGEIVELIDPFDKVAHRCVVVGFGRREISLDTDPEFHLSATFLHRRDLVRVKGYQYEVHGLSADKKRITLRRLTARVRKICGLEEPAPALPNDNIKENSQ
jgi:hypothetical protein